MDDLFEICKTKFKYNQEVYEYSRKQIIKCHYDKFVLIEGFYDFSYDLGCVLDRCIPEPEKPFLQFALLRIHEKAIKVYREAEILLENGSASGAMARWRVLFELSVIAQILNKYPDLAQKYIEYASVDDYKYAKKLMTYKDRLKLDHYNMDIYPEIETVYKETCQKYGWTGKSYEWAQNDDIKTPNLFELAKNIGQEHLYAYVNEAHLYNHPSMRYLIQDRGAKSPEADDKCIYLFTPFEMNLPMQLIVCSMHQINFACIKCYFTLENVDKEQMQFYLEKNDEFPEAIIKLVMIETRNQINTD